MTPISTLCIITGTEWRQLCTAHPEEMSEIIIQGMHQLHHAPKITADRVVLQSSPRHVLPRWFRGCDVCAGGVVVYVAAGESVIASHDSGSSRNICLSEDRSDGSLNLFPYSFQKRRPVTTLKLHSVLALIYAGSRRISQPSTFACPTSGSPYERGNTLMVIFHKRVKK